MNTIKTTQAVGAPIERQVRPHQRRECTQRYTWLVRYMRRFGDRKAPPGCPHYALQFVDYQEPSGGGSIAMELGPCGRSEKTMANLELAAAFGAADAAKEQDLRGYYPMAARVLADEVHRLRHLYEMAVCGRAEMRTALRQEREQLEARYTALLKAVADGRAMQPAPPILVDLGPNVIANRPGKARDDV